MRGATNDAIAKTRQFHGDAMKELLGGADMAGLSEALARLGEGQPVDRGPEKTGVRAGFARQATKDIQP